MTRPYQRHDQTPVFRVSPITGCAPQSWITRTPWLAVQHSAWLIKWTWRLAFNSGRDFEMAVQAIVESIKRKISQLSIGTYDESADVKLPGGVLAHSTITKMLSLTNHETTFGKTDLQSTDQMGRRELRVLDALATVLDRTGEVVAVVKSDDGSGVVEVIVATHLVRNEERHPTKKLGSFGERFWKVFANKPPPRDGQRDSLRSISNSPTIINPSLPQLEFENIDWLKLSINQGW
jgi:hypothetical protein